MGLGTFSNLNFMYQQPNSFQPWLQPTDINKYSFPTSTLGNNVWGMGGFSTYPMGGMPIFTSTSTSGSTSGSSTDETKVREGESYEDYQKRMKKLREKQTEANKAEVAKQNQSVVFTGLTKDEEKVLTDYHAKKQEYVEDLGTSLVLGAGIGVVLPNMRNITHGGSALKAGFSKNSATNQIFKDVVKTDLWKKEANLMQDAYAQLHKAEVRANNWKIQGAFKRGYTSAEFDLIKDEMERALRSGNKDQILEATAKLKNANSIGEGWVSRAWNWTKGKLGMTPKASVDALDKMTDTAGVQKQMAGLAASSANGTFKGALKNSVGGKIGILFAATSLISEWKYISAAFAEDTTTGFKQLGQSVLKAGSSWGGYILGDALGKWGGAKLGAMIGTAVCPGLGTAIGAVAGVVCGTVCSWGLRKLCNWAVGDNVANDLIAKNDVKKAIESPEQQMALVQQIVANADADKNLDAKTKQVVDKVKQMYEQQALLAQQAQQAQQAGQQIAYA